MGNVQKTSRWLGVKLGVTVVHKNGMIESYEESSGASVEAWVDKGETVEGVSNQLLGKLQDLVDAEKTRIKSKLREKAGYHAGPGIPRIHEEIMTEPPKEIPSQEEGAKDQVQKSLDNGAEEEPDFVFWFGKQEDKKVSECSIGSLQWHVNQGDIYKNGKKDNAEEGDPDAFQLARAIDWQLAKKKKEGGK